MMRHKDRHHRLPTSRGGKNTNDNVIVVPISKHRAYHQLFNNMLPNEVAAVLTETWIDPAYYMVAIPRAKVRKIKQGKKIYILVEVEV